MAEAEESTSKASGPASPQQQAEDSYDLDQLVMYSQDIFGQPSFVLHGAISMAGLTGTATKSEMQAAIDEFLAQEEAPQGQGE